MIKVDACHAALLLGDSQPGRALVVVFSDGRIGKGARVAKELRQECTSPPLANVREDDQTAEHRR